MFQFLNKSLRCSVCFISMVYAPTAFSAVTNIPIDSATDQATELLNREGRATLLEDTIPSAKVSDEKIVEAINKQSSQPAPPTLDIEALKADPLAFTKYLNAAIAAQDMVTVKKLLPIYRSLEINDPMLIKFADALVYRGNLQNKKAIEIYKSMLADNPNFHPVRLQLAQTLYADKQYASAKSQLMKLSATNIPKPFMDQVQGLLTEINRQEQWRFNASLSALRDDNLNDAPSESIRSQYGSTAKPISGKGVQLSASAQKRQNLSTNFYTTFGGNASLKTYFGDASDYNDYLLTASAGIGYDDAKKDMVITPFITKRIYNDESYSTRKGLTFNGSRWLKPKFRLTATSILSNETFDKKVDKNRETDGQFFGLNGLFMKDATQYFYGGVGAYRNDVPKSSIISYDRNSINTGWGREWKKGVSTLTTLSYAKKEYEKPDAGIAGGYYAQFGGKPGTNRQDKTTSLGLQVWKRDYTLLGLTPRLVMNYDTTSSNFKYYDDREDKSATILLTKTF